jgi:hypothetical protein
VSLGFSKSDKAQSFPILFLLAANIVCGLFVFRDYGLSWDEPLFYDYADALGYAYSPQEWFGGNFNLENAYGSSGTDHANRGPAYILLARQPVYLLESFGIDSASAWHLVNFLTFQLGIYFFYQLALRLMKPSAALASAALFAWQPLLWGHAFINPKDPPFLVFFLGSAVLGFEMVDKLKDEAEGKQQKFFYVIFPAIFLGIATSIRVLGPLAGLIVFVYALANLKPRIYLFTCLLVYLFTAILTIFITWPYLWPDPIGRFLEVFRFMSGNPTQLAVLFNGELYQADELPRRYLPILLNITLTELVWLLFISGLIIGIWKQFFGNRKLTTEYWLILSWFLIPFLYVILRTPPMYDGYRHFLFILPPVFVIAGLALDKLYGLIKTSWITVFITSLLLAPGIIGIIQLHPYEYAYYNSFTGGTTGAFRTYETDYWLTCYKEAIEDFQTQITDPATIYVHREAYIAAAYAKSSVTVLEERGALDQIKSGDYILVNSRANEDVKTFKGAPIVLETGRGDAVFCVIKRIP